MVQQDGVIVTGVANGKIGAASIRQLPRRFGLIAAYDGVDVVF